MRSLGTKRTLLGALCAATLALAAGAAPALGAADDPEILFHNTNPSEPGEPGPVPPGSFEGICGLAVDITGSTYVSDYYHRVVDVLSAAQEYVTQVTNVDPLDGPCGLAVDSSGTLYVNDLHRNVSRFSPSVFPLLPTSTFSSGTVIDSSDPTGVAVNAVTNNVYINDRTHVAVYDPFGSLVQQIATGASLDNGYGIAVSAFPGTTGRVYVPDAATNTVEVYDPGFSTEMSVESISPPGGFSDLHDSAVAVDRATGHIYVVDRIGSRLTHHPEAVVQVFNPAGVYLGRLKYNVIDGDPVGLAVDNSSGANQGRVYVTTGNSDVAANTDLSGFYAYPPGAETNTELPAVFSLSVSAEGSGNGTVTSSASGSSCAGHCEAEVLAGSGVTLTAAPAPGSAFLGWSGAGCSGAGECEVTMSEARSVSAIFADLSPPAAAPTQTPAAPSAAADPAAVGSAARMPAAVRRHRVHRHHRATRHHRAAHHRLQRRSS